MVLSFLPESGLWEGHDAWWPATWQRGISLLWTHHLQEGQKGQVQCMLDGSRRQIPWWSKASSRDDVTFLIGKEPKVVGEVAKFWFNNSRNSYKIETLCCNLRKMWNRFSVILFFFSMSLEWNYLDATRDNRWSVFTCFLLFLQTLFFNTFHLKFSLTCSNLLAHDYDCSVEYSPPYLLSLTS